MTIKELFNSCDFAEVADDMKVFIAAYNNENE